MRALFFFLGFFVVLFLASGKKPPVRSEVVPVQAPTPVQRNKVLPLIARINKRNAAIRSISTDLEIQISGIFFKCRGQLAYEKDKNFRLLIRSVAGRESDIGSNTRFFWFWSKRMNDPYIYYARHEDVHRVPLKNPFQPLWLKASLGIDPMPTNNITVGKMGEFLVVDEKCLGTEGNTLTRRLLIRDQKFYGQYLIEKNRLTASTEILEYQFVDGVEIPKTIKIVWYDENVVLIWHLKKSRVNPALNSELWQMPNFTQQRDLTREW